MNSWITNALDRAMTVATLAAAVGTLWVIITGRPILTHRSEAPGVPRPAPQVIEDVTGQTALGTNTMGEQEATLALIEFADFQCPYCERYARETLTHIQDVFIKTGKVIYAFRHAPLPIHEFAKDAGKAAECAAQQGHFWEMHNRLFSGADGLTHNGLISSAQYLQLDVVPFTICLNGASIESRLMTDLAAARRLSITATPTFFIGRINSDKQTVELVKRINGAQPYQTFERVLASLSIKS